MRGVKWLSRTNEAVFSFLFFCFSVFLFLFVISPAAESIPGRFTELHSSHSGFERVTAKYETLVVSVLPPLPARQESLAATELTQLVLFVLW